MPRGRKAVLPGTVPLYGSVEPTSDLDEAGMAEFQRLAGVLRERTTLERVELGTLTAAARVTGLLVQLYELPDPPVPEIARLESLRLSLMRSLGFGLQPSRAVFRQNPSAKGVEAGDKFADLKARFGVG